MQDKERFKELFYDHYARLCHIALKMIPNKDTCEDIVQECFLNLWEKHRLDNVSNPGAYLTLVVRNRCIDYLRQKNSDISFDDNISLHEHDIVEESYEEKPDAVKIISQALSLLPPKCREIFELSKIKRKTYQEIANELNLSIKTIENQMGKAIKIIRQFAKDHPQYFILIIAFLIES
ncbi:RNA polymerase sigma-70 factor [Porphyromonas pogonae]|uniref:RNA polymerase sigma-70 factor n=1 Tax=Porphyromonas pogonae TaxID=867595 RepID=UPI002E79DFCC|nr:RNA polymerase sigma-70 factor [Porphyromonas pogonae]